MVKANVNTAVVAALAQLDVIDGELNSSSASIVTNVRADVLRARDALKQIQQVAVFEPNTF